MKEYDIVILKRDIPELELEKGTTGAILMVYDEPNLPLSYEVEFVDSNGESIKTETIKKEDLELK